MKKKSIGLGRLLLFFFTGIIIGFFGFLSIRPGLINALTQSFVQTNWIGGADTGTTIDSSHMTDWTKFYSKDDSINIGTSGEIKLNLSP